MLDVKSITSPIILTGSNLRFYPFIIKLSFSVCLKCIDSNHTRLVSRLQPASLQIFCANTKVKSSIQEFLLFLYGKKLEVPVA